MSFSYEYFFFSRSNHHYGQEQKNGAWILEGITIHLAYAFIRYLSSTHISHSYHFLLKCLHQNRSMSGDVYVC